MTTILTHNAETMKLAAEAIAGGGVIAFRTDTFYGLGADPFNPAALRKLARLKGRGETKAILVVVSDLDGVERFVAAPSQLFEILVARFWPGPLTLVARARAGVPRQLTAGTGNLGVRLPDDEHVREVVRACGGALTATSANLAGAAPARSAEESAHAFPDGLSLIIDGGPTHAAKPSTVLDVSDDQSARLLREGIINGAEISRVLESIGAKLLSGE